MQTLITHATLVMEDHYCPDAFLWIRDGKIADFGPMRQAGVAGSAPRLNVQGALVGPGLIDIHTHAGGNVFFQDNPAAASRALLEHGVTGVLPALYMTFEPARIHRRPWTAIDAARAAGQCGNILGYYMEGPYLNPALRLPARRSYRLGRRDPARRNIGALVRPRARQREGVGARPGARGHRGTFARDDVRREKRRRRALRGAQRPPRPSRSPPCMPYGLRLATHHTNATGTLQQIPRVPRAPAWTRPCSTIDGYLCRADCRRARHSRGSLYAAAGAQNQGRCAHCADFGRLCERRPHSARDTTASRTSILILPGKSPARASRWTPCAGT